MRLPKNRAYVNQTATADWGERQELQTEFGPVNKYGKDKCSPTWIELKKALHEDHGGRCQGCGYKGEVCDFNIDHKIATKRGGTNDSYNLQFLCRPCNTGKGSMSDTEWRAKGMRYVKPQEWGYTKWKNYVGSRRRSALGQLGRLVHS